MTRADVSPVIVLRSHPVVLALQQVFWDKHSVGRLKRVLHPETLRKTQYIAQKHGCAYIHAT